MERLDNLRHVKFPLWMAATCTGFIISFIYSLARHILTEPEAVLIAYPTDILSSTPAPLYQADYPLDDAIFSSNFESGNLKSVM